MPRAKLRNVTERQMERKSRERGEGEVVKGALQSGNSDTHRIILMEIHNERRFKKFHVAKGDTARKLSAFLDVAGDFKGLQAGTG